MPPRTKTSVLSISFDQNATPVAFKPVIAEHLHPNCPSYVFFAPCDAPQGDLRLQVAHSLNKHGDAVFAAFRYAIYQEAHAADGGGFNRPVECEDAPGPSFGSDLPGIGRDFKAPEVVTKLRSDGFRLPETFRTGFRTDCLTGELRAYTLSHVVPGGKLAALIHLQLIRMGADASNRLVWPAQVLPR